MLLPWPPQRVMVRGSLTAVPESNFTGVLGIPRYPAAMSVSTVVPCRPLARQAKQIARSASTVFAALWRCFRAFLFS